MKNTPTDTANTGLMYLHEEKYWGMGRQMSKLTVIIFIADSWKHSELRIHGAPFQFISDIT